MKNNLVEYKDIEKLADLSRKHDDNGVVSYIKELQDIYDSKILLPVVKSFYFAIMGKNEYKSLLKKMFEELPQFNFFNPFPGKCSGGEWDEICRQESINLQYLVEKLKPLDVCSANPQNIYTIPHILHNVWTTSSVKNDDQKLSSYMKNNLYQNHNFQLTKDWGHIMWLTSPELTPASIISEVEKYGFQVRYINELATDDKSSYLVSSAIVFSVMGYYSIHTDIIRNLALYNMGGVYIDGDYNLYKNPAPLIDKFNYVVGRVANQVITIENYFLASVKSHHIMASIQDILLNNLNNTAPNYVRYPCTDNNKENGLMIISNTLGYVKDEGVDKSLDVILPWGILGSRDFPEFYEMHRCINADFVREIGFVGADDHLGTWRDLSPLDYSNDA